MNQIIFSKFNQEIKLEQDKKKKKMLVLFKYQFFISIFIIIGCFSYYMYNMKLTKQKESLSKQLLSNYNIDMLYAKNEEYTTTLDSIEEKNADPFVIGLIEIKKINIVYPILSEVNDDLLKIATCRFFGPMPNEVR